MIKLVKWATDQMGKPFKWGETNCVALALAGIDAQHDTDLLDKYRKHMASERKAWAWMERHGMDAIVLRLKDDGLVLIPAGFAQPGDIVLNTHPASGVSAAVLLPGIKALSSTVQHGVVIQTATDWLLQDAIILGVR
ncbi:hypothetical protein VSS37_05890 [Candidatus Thiothrix sp. Deng01]|uniref:DUF6950 domain-containing protein n=1 Tax=Candidatus Thiothrix phosphatis TaxID=3112415 RepID=A0ABU6CUM7_9GAMM|nr:hypothetical protein [Candidatus Thiothrix sp. Deng01]MEB4590503.1 hypothetical protein [Candidatus Thiothrix sp. Deng01]